MRFGFATMPVGPHPLRPYTEIVETVRMAERLGYDAAWMPDQTFHRDPYVTLAAVALSTSRIELGVGVTNPSTRHSAMTARAAATLNEIAKGRFVLGIGAGNRRQLLDPLGLPTDRPGQRCREAAATIKQLLAGRAVTQESPTLTMRQVALEMYTQPTTRVYVGGRGPQILQAAGEVADGVIIGGLVSDTGLAFALQHVQEGARLAGRDLEGFEVINWVLTIVTDKKADLLDAARPTVAHIIGGASADVLSASGIPEGLMRSIRLAYAEGGLKEAAPLVSTDLISQFTLIGDATELAERISRLYDCGVRQIAVVMPAATRGIEASEGFDTTQNLIRLAEDVMPRVNHR